MTQHYRLLGLSGSLRRDAYSTTVLKTLAEAVGARASVTIADIGALPHYNHDLDTSQPPESVALLRRQIGEADGLLVVSPEYNHGMPGLLKNAIDWASRPAFASTLIGKPVMAVTVSPAFTGGVRAHYQLRETFAACLARPVAAAEVVIGLANTKIADGWLADEASLSFALNGIEALYREIDLLRE